MSGEDRVSSGRSSPSLRRQAVTSPGLDSQESSWIGLLSLVSRPALSFLQRYLPTRPRTPSRSNEGASWMDAGQKNSFVDEEAEFLRQLDDMVPLTQHAAPHLTYLRCRHDGGGGPVQPGGGPVQPGGGPVQPGGGGPVPWLTADSLREIGIKSAEELDLNFCHENYLGYSSSAKTLLSQVWLGSVTPQEDKPTGRRDWAAEAVSPSVNSSSWLGSFWGGQESAPKGLLSSLSWADEGTLIGPFCPQQPKSETKVPTAQTAALFVQNDGRDWILGENTGPTGHTDATANNGGPQTVRNREGSTLDHRLSSSDALLTPDQDNGYSSLEEEHLHMFRLYVAKVISTEPPPEAEPCSAVRTEPMEDRPVGSSSGTVDEKNQTEREEAASRGQSEEEPVAPHCQNKTIAFIMGCPCSDEESSQSDVESSGDDDDDDDDDDGFDSEGLSDPDSSDEDDESSDSEAERLWSSLCHSQDPYNPQNFTARLHTSTTLPKAVPTSTPPSSTHSTPASSPDFTPLPRSSPPSSSDFWDDSTSSSEVDEAESLRLWSSLSCSSDPYSPLNFQAPLRTRGAVEPEPRARAKKASQTPLRSLRRTPAPPTEHKKEEAEERLDSGFCEASTSSTKKVSVLLPSFSC